MATIKWAIMGTGTIAKSFAQGLGQLSDAELYAVGSRSLQSAEQFGNNFPAQKYYGSYEALVRDPDVDVVYIATPNSAHKDNILLCLNHGKPVLCEKPFTLNRHETAEVIRVAREKKLFLMEGMWTRFFPVYRQIREWLDANAIGPVRMVSADFGFRREGPAEDRKVGLHRGGGALMDVGVYPISFASWVFQQPPSTITGVASLYETGVDELSAMTLLYPDGQVAVLSCSINTPTQKEARIIGNKGTIVIPEFSKAISATLAVIGEEPVTVTFPLEGNGYNYQAAAVMACLRAGETECELMPLDESLTIMVQMDELRQQWGIVFPGENKA